MKTRENNKNGCRMIMRHFDKWACSWFTTIQNSYTSTIFLMSLSAFFALNFFTVASATLSLIVNSSREKEIKWKWKWEKKCVSRRFDHDIVRSKIFLCVVKQLYGWKFKTQTFCIFFRSSFDWKCVKVLEVTDTSFFSSWPKANFLLLWWKLLSRQFDWKPPKFVILTGWCWEWYWIWNSIEYGTALYVERYWLWNSVLPFICTVGIRTHTLQVSIDKSTKYWTICYQLKLVFKYFFDFMTKLKYQHSLKQGFFFLLNKSKLFISKTSNNVASTNFHANETKTENFSRQWRRCKSVKM